MLNLLGQGVLLKPFGTSYAETLTFLESSEIGHLSTVDQKQLTVSTSDYEVLHHFKHDMLYKTEVVHFYQDKSKVKEALASLRHNYEKQKGEILDLNTSKDATAYAVRLDNELHEIHLVRLGKKGFQLLQVSLDLGACSFEEYAALEQDRVLASLLTRK